MTPLPTPQAQRIWSLLLEGIDLVAAPRESHTSLAELVKDLLAQDSSHHRRAATPLALESGPDPGPTQPPNLCRDPHPSVLRLKLLPKLS